MRRLARSAHRWCRKYSVATCSAASHQARVQRSSSAIAPGRRAPMLVAAVRCGGGLESSRRRPPGGAGGDMPQPRGEPGRDRLGACARADPRLRPLPRRGPGLAQPGPPRLQRGAPARPPPPPLTGWGAVGCVLAARRRTQASPLPPQPSRGQLKICAWQPSYPPCLQQGMAGAQAVQCCLPAVLPPAGRYVAMPALVT